MKKRLKPFTLYLFYQYESPYSGCSHDELSGPITVQAINRESAEKKAEKILREGHPHIEWVKWARTKQEMDQWEDSY